MEIFIELVIVLIKAAVVMGALLHLAALCIWVERKGAALIQDRVGANRAAILGFDLAGILNTLVCDPVKALLKEDFVPKGTSQFLHSMGPFLAVFPVLVSFAVIPFGPPIHVFGKEITLQLADLNIGVLYVFAMGSIAVYGVVLAGWVGNNKFSLFGGLRASAQMISYEVTMGLSIIGLIAIYQSVNLNDIIQAQSGTIFGFIPRWGIFLNPIGFLLFFTSMMAETKRAPFDLPESESEIVAGYLTEYSGMKFLLFWLGEFAEIVVASALVVILFFGGWQLPWFDITTIPADLWGIAPFGLSELFKEYNIQWGPILGALIILPAKISFFCVLQIIIRWTLPRFRYDQLMNLCWKYMLPVSIANVVLTVAILLLIKGA
jgi:NADH-quinone oxidoreductase subunit H